MGRKPEGNAEKMFKNLGKKIDELLTDLENSTDKAKEKYADRFEEIQRNKETLKKDFADFKENNKDKWEEAESSLKRAGTEIKTAFKTAFSKTSK